MKKVFAIFAIAGLIATSSCGNKAAEEAATADSLAAVAKADSIAAAEAAAAQAAADSAAAAAADTTAAPAQ
jgi:hypothetical protein